MHMQIGTPNVLSFKLINYDISDNGPSTLTFPQREKYSKTAINQSLTGRNREGENVFITDYKFGLRL